MGKTAKSHTAGNGLITKDLHRVKQRLREEIHNGLQNDFVGRLLNRKNLFEGKLIRPRLVLLSERLCGSDKKVESSRLAVETAAAIELLHNATLLHDDVIDQARTRRNTETLNLAEGNRLAVLAGDFLLARVFRMCSGFPSSVTEIISRAASRSCAGEIAQIAQAGDRGICEREYLQIITDKTAAIFSACFQLGAATEECGTRIQEKLADVGENMGIAYQLNDDLLDIAGSEQNEGKTLGTDALDDKPTLPVIHFFKNADVKQKAVFDDNLNNNPEPGAFMANQLRKTGSLVYTHEKINNYIAEALRTLDTFPDCPAGAELKEICCEIRQKSEPYL